MKAIWKDKIIAESLKTELIEGNVYFPPDSINREYLDESDLHTTCVWKGVASYYSLTDGTDKLVNGAWYYPGPSDAAKRIKDYVAFVKDVKIVA